MYKEISFHDFQEAFRDYDRHGQYSYEAQKALFEHLEQLEEDMGEKIELDVIALCCEFSELTDAEFREQYDYDGEPSEHDLVLCGLDNGNWLVVE